MPGIGLTRLEAKEALPDVCVCCGAPATERVPHRFFARPPAVNGPSGFLEIYAARLMIATANTPRFTLQLPFCDEHRNYWHRQSVLLYGGLAGMGAALLVGIVITALLMTVGKVDAPWLTCCAAGPFLLVFVAWLIPLKLSMDKAIRAWRIEDTVFVQNVGEEFVAAVLAARPARPGPPPLPGAQSPVRPSPPPLPDSHRRPSEGRPGPPPLPDGYGSGS